MEKEIDLYFIRHGEHNTETDNSFEKDQLTDQGIAECRNIGLAIFEEQNLFAFTINNRRSTATVMIAMDPDLEYERESHEEFFKKSYQKGKIRFLESMAYISEGDKRFFDGLKEAFYNKQTLRFLVNQSDSYREESGIPISSYSTMAFDVSRIILKYYEICNSWKPSNLNQGEKHKFSRLFCAREFIYPSFRSKLIELLLGSKERDRYVDWYTDNKEWQSKSREDISKISIEVVDSQNNGTNARIYLKDDYGEIMFGKEELEAIISDYNSLFKI